MIKLSARLFPPGFLSSMLSSSESNGPPSDVVLTNAHNHLLRPSIWLLTLFALVYLAAAWSGTVLTIALPLGACLWPPSGIFAAALLSSSVRVWPYFVMVALTSDITASVLIYGFSLKMALVIAVGNALEAVFGATLVVLWTKRPADLYSLKFVLAFILFSGFLAPCISAVFGATALTLFHGQPYWVSYQLWWVGDAVGVLMVAPLVLEIIAGVHRRNCWSAWRIAHFATMLGIVIGVGHFVFSGQYPFVYLMTPLLLWAALAFEGAGAAIVIAVLTVLATVYTAAGRGPFAAEQYDAGQRQLLVQAFILISAMSTLLLAVLVRHWHRSKELLVRAVNDAVARAERGAVQLRESEATFRAVFEHSGSGIAILDSAGTILRCNSAYHLMLGYGESELIGSNCADQVADDDRSVYETHWQELAKHGTAFSALEVRYHKKNDEIIWVRKVVSPLPLNDDHGHRFVVLIADVNAHHEEAIALLDAERNKDEFLATLAHELRNPLSPISNGIYLLRSGEDSKRDYALDIMQRQVAQMTRLIDDLLDISRIGSGKILLQLELVAVTQIVDVALETIQAALDAARHSLSKDYAEPVWVMGDRARLIQVVTNLLINAIKYTPPGGEINLQVGREDDWAVIRVRDNGSGIPPSMLEAVFAMFAQVNRTLDRAQGGLGIGLALVRELVHLHGGSITAESEGIGRGSTFTVYLPVSVTPVVS